MNIALFFEGTGRGVEGDITNVTRMKNLSREDGSQRLHLESGPGTHFGAYLSGRVAGTDWRRIFASARRWFEANYETLPSDSLSTRVYLFGFSRGALLARHFSAWLDKLGIEVAYLGLWDTVDSTPGLDVSGTCPANVRAARHAVARDETRKFFAPVRLLPAEASGGSSSRKRQRVTELVFPGVHSDVGGLYEDNHVIADVSLAWIAAGAKREGLRLVKGAKIVQKTAESPKTHDSHNLASNLWGAIGKVRRVLDGLRTHRAFAKS